MRNLSLDQAKIILALMVVCIHSSLLKDFSDSVNYYFVQSIFRVAVPVFFIISGFYFYSYLARGGDFKRWAIRLLIMHTIWSLVYLYFYIPYGDPLPEIFLEVVKRYIEGYLHLWFLMALLGGSVLLMLLRKLKDVQLLAAALLIFICGALIQYAGAYHVFAGEYLDKLFNKTHIYRNFLFVGFPFLAIGYLIAKNKERLLARKKVLVGFLIIGSGFLALEGVFNLILNHNENFDILFSLMIFAPFLFMLLLFSKRVTATPLYSDISASIYFTHPLFIEIFSAYFQSRLAITMATVVFSIIAYFFIVKINKKYNYIL